MELQDQDHVDLDAFLINFEQAHKRAFLARLER